jgi:hypothetical protein
VGESSPDVRESSPDLGKSSHDLGKSSYVLDQAAAVLFLSPPDRSRLAAVVERSSPVRYGLASCSFQSEADLSESSARSEQWVDERGSLSAVRRKSFGVLGKARA